MPGQPVLPGGWPLGPGVGGRPGRPPSQGLGSPAAWHRPRYSQHSRSGPAGTCWPGWAACCGGHGRGPAGDPPSGTHTERRRPPVPRGRGQPGTCCPGPVGTRLSHRGRRYAPGTAGGGAPRRRRGSVAGAAVAVRTRWPPRAAGRRGTATCWRLGGHSAGVAPCWLGPHGSAACRCGCLADTTGAAGGACVQPAEHPECGRRWHAPA